MAERSRNSPSSSRTTKMKFAPKHPGSKQKKATARSSSQQETEDGPVIDKEIVTRMRIRQAAKTTTAGTDGDSADKTPQSSAQEDLKSELDRCNKYGPYIALPMRADKSHSEELNKLEFGQPSLTSYEMEASVNPAKVLGLEKVSEVRRMLRFKFPPLPYEIPARSTEATDSKGKTKAKKLGCNLQQLSPGYVGKMLVYKSGKVKMKIGDEIFDVNPGANYIFHEEAVAINTKHPKQEHWCELGNIEQHVVVTPDVDAMLEGSKK